MTSAPAPLLPASGFTRELTPTWLATATLLAGHRPLDTGRLGRVVVLGCGRGETAAVVAANHPHAEVWVWAPDPGSSEAVRRLGDAAGLDNLVVGHHGELPLDLGGGAADVVVVDGVLAGAGDDERARLARALDAGVRPGGLLCTTYPTLAAWSELAPVILLLRRLAVTYRGAAGQRVDRVLAELDRVRAAGARYLLERPVVAEWIDGLRSVDPDELSTAYLDAPFRPMSPAQVATSVAPAGAVPLGSARLVDGPVELPAALEAEVSAATHPGVREVYRDLAARPSYRLDLFRIGGAPLESSELRTRLGQLSLAGLAGPKEAPATSVDPMAWRNLTSLGVTADELHVDAAQVVRTTRVLLDAGQAHPVVAGGPSRGAIEACEALNTVFEGSTRTADLRAVPLLGSAVAAARSGIVRGTPVGRRVAGS